MADSAPDSKVEDVLSSVRRLVSQEIPKREGPKPVAPDAGALVLTPKDRIEADPKVRHDTRSLEERIAELEAAVDSTSAEFEPDGSEDQAQHRPDRIVFTRPRPGEEARRRRTTLRLSEIALIETGPANEAETSEEPKVAFRHEPSRPRSPDEAPMAEDVPTLPAASAELHAFSDDPDDVVARIEARIERGGEAAPVVPEQAQQPPPAEEAEEDEDNFSAALSAAVAASRQSLEPQKEDDVPDERDTLRSDEDRHVSTPLEAETDELTISGPADTTHRATPVKPVATAETAEAPAVSNEPPAAPAAPAAEAPVENEQTRRAAAEAALDALADEDALRLLVGRLMREELQGKLGERITHNVRKLVRREVKRVLEARDLD